jgi:hypothetical protein
VKDIKTIRLKPNISAQKAIMGEIYVSKASNKIITINEALQDLTAPLKRDKK